jgi:hypothetical protein
MSTQSEDRSTQSEYQRPRPPVNRLDAAIIASGALIFIVSFLPWVGLNLGFADITADAWSVGFWAWFPVMLCLAVAAATAAHAFLGVKLPAAGQAGPRFLLGLVSAVAVVILFIRMVTLISESSPTAGGTRWGLYVAFILVAAQLVLGYYAIREHGEKIPVPQGTRSDGRH